jgi:tetratricopeptide (TPR) repeat protein
VCYDPAMRPLCFAMGLWLATAPLLAADTLSDARRFYNQGQFDAAERAAREAARLPATANAARVVLGRIQLERFRRAPVPGELAGAISAFANIDARRLDPRERIEFTIGLGEALYLEDRFGAAAALFDSVLDASQSLGEGAHERVLDWWATAVDRQAQLRPAPERAEPYGRISTRMAAEISQDAGSIAAGYWLSAAARGSGDPDRALSEATAAWVRAALARDGGVALRADLDRLVVQGILPDRAARLTVRDHPQALAGMVGEWEAFKSSWSR